MKLHEAMFYEKYADTIICKLCPHYCKLEDGMTGRCGVRQHLKGKLYGMSYGKLLAASLDPVEKKPLYHFYPGKKIFSVGSYGCNMHCQFCQNYSLSQARLDSREVSVDSLIDHVDGIGVAFTYNEPTIMYEYVYAAAKALKNKGFKVVLVTNGLINEPPLRKLLPYIDAFNVDLKSFDKAEYIKLGGHLDTVLKSIKIMNEKHLEVTSLMVTDDVSTEMIEMMAQYIGSINKNIPFHISRYFPNYHYDKEATPMDQLIKAKELASQHLNYVYIGNALKENHTYCSACGKILIHRIGYDIELLCEDTCNCGQAHTIVMENKHDINR